MPRASQKNLITSDKDYTKNEMEFLKAVEDYIHFTGKKFPAWTEIYQVLIMLGYRKETIPIKTKVEFKTITLKERFRHGILISQKLWSQKITDWSIGSFLIRKSFQEFNTSYGIYLGECKSGYVVGVKKLNLHYPYKFEIFKSLEDLKFIWEIDYD